MEGGPVLRTPAGLSALTLVLSAVAASSGATPVSVYGAWHCGNDFCTWTTVRSLPCQ